MQVKIGTFLRNNDGMITLPIKLYCLDSVVHKCVVLQNTVFSSLVNGFYTQFQSVSGFI